MTGPELRAAIRALFPAASLADVLAVEGLISRQAEQIARTPKSQRASQRRTA